MSNKRKTQPAARVRPDVAAASLRAERDGTLSLVWPKGRPKVVALPPEALEALVDAHNGAVLAPPAPAPAAAPRRWWSRWR